MLFIAVHKHSFLRVLSFLFTNINTVIGNPYLIKVLLCQLSVIAFIDKIMSYLIVVKVLIKVIRTLYVYIIYMCVFWITIKCYWNALCLMFKEFYTRDRMYIRFPVTICQRWTSTKSRHLERKVISLTSLTSAFIFQNRKKNIYREQKGESPLL